MCMRGVVLLSAESAEDERAKYNPAVRKNLEIQWGQIVVLNASWTPYLVPVFFQAEQTLDAGKLRLGVVKKKGFSQYLKKHRASFSHRSQFR
jgi:hypothetical protein